MKIILFVFVVMSLVGMVVVQSNVILYGSIDEGVVYINSFKSGVVSGLVLCMDFGIMQLDCFGLCGLEDLGGGMQVIFQLELGFLGDFGNSVVVGKLFNWVVWVGFINDCLGNIQFGYQVDFMFDYFGCLSNGFQFINFYLFYFGNFDNLVNQFQIDNVVCYVLLIFGGL